MGPSAPKWSFLGFRRPWCRSAAMCPKSPGVLSAYLGALECLFRQVPGWGDTHPPKKQSNSCEAKLTNIWPSRKLLPKIDQILFRALWGKELSKLTKYSIPKCQQHNFDLFGVPGANPGSIWTPLAGGGPDPPTPSWYRTLVFGSGNSREQARQPFAPAAIRPSPGQTPRRPPSWPRPASSAAPTPMVGVPEREIVQQEKLPSRDPSQQVGGVGFFPFGKAFFSGGTGKPENNYSGCALEPQQAATPAPPTHTSSGLPRAAVPGSDTFAPRGASRAATMSSCASKRSAGAGAGEGAAGPRRASAAHCSRRSKRSVSLEKSGRCGARGGGGGGRVAGGGISGRAGPVSPPPRQHSRPSSAHLDDAQPAATTSSTAGFSDGSGG